MLKLIHTADVHIGVKFGAFGKRAEEQRKALRDALAKIADRAVSERAQLLLIAGDLFDSNFPSYDSVGFVKTQFKKLNDAGVYVAIVPGTHDCLSGDSIYKREHFAAQFPRVHVFDDPAITTKEFPDIDTTVYAKANVSNKSSESPVAFLASAVKSAATKYTVAMAHGSVQIEGKSARDDMPIEPKDIERSGVQYLALGHWHGCQDFSAKGVVAWYSGSPEVTYQEGKGGIGQGYALSVEITEDGGAQVTPLKISQKEVAEIRLDMQVTETMEQAYFELEQRASPNRIAVVTFAGVAPAGVFIDPEKIERDFADAFFSITVSDETVSAEEEITELNYPEELVIGQFVRIMQQRITNAKDPAERQRMTEALHLGVAELEGKNILG
ncbi:MAG: DNA repair exonuclease [Patescibacteria group bacterium]